MRGTRVGASDPETLEGSTTVGASDGGGKSEGELPAPEGVRTTAPPSCCVGKSSSRRGRPCSPMGTRKMAGESESLAKGGNRGPADPPVSRPREK